MSNTTISLESFPMVNRALFTIAQHIVETFRNELAIVENYLRQNIHMSDEIEKGYIEKMLRINKAFRGSLISTLSQVELDERYDVMRALAWMQSEDKQKSLLTYPSGPMFKRLNAQYKLLSTLLLELNNTDNSNMSIQRYIALYEQI